MAFLAALWLPSCCRRFRLRRQLHHAHGAALSSQRLPQIPDEDKVLAALRGAGLTRVCTSSVLHHKDMKSPALVEKQKQDRSGS